jgi:hypothetical protein
MELTDGDRFRIGPESHLTPGYSKFAAIDRYDVFRLPRSRHIEEVKPHPFSHKAPRSIDTPCLAKFFPVSLPF